MLGRCLRLRLLSRRVGSSINRWAHWNRRRCYDGQMREVRFGPRVRAAALLPLAFAVSVSVSSVLAFCTGLLGLCFGTGLRGQWDGRHEHEPSRRHALFISSRKRVEPSCVASRSTITIATEWWDRGSWIAPSAPDALDSFCSSFADAGVWTWTLEALRCDTLHAVDRWC